MKKLMIMLALVLAGSNAYAVRGQEISSAAAELAARRAAKAVTVNNTVATTGQTTGAQRAARQTRNEYGNNASEQNKAKSASTQSTQKDNAPQPEKEKQPEKENVPQTESASTSSEDAPSVNKEPVVEAQSSRIGGLVKSLTLTGLAGGVAGLFLMACKAYMVANPVIYPVLYHNTAAGISWCIANCL